MYRYVGTHVGTVVAGWVGRQETGGIRRHAHRQVDRKVGRYVRNPWTLSRFGSSGSPGSACHPPGADPGDLVRTPHTPKNNYVQGILFVSMPPRPGAQNPSNNRIM